jgi:hypothetical protein
MMYCLSIYRKKLANLQAIKKTCGVNFQNQFSNTDFST